MSMSWGENFAEGDSGVPMPNVTLWSNIGDEKAKDKTKDNYLSDDTLTAIDEENLRTEVYAVVQEQGIKEDRKTRSEVRTEVEIVINTSYETAIITALSISLDKRNAVGDQIAALEVARKVLLDYSTFGRSPKLEA